MPLVTGALTADGAVVDLLVGVSEQRRQRLLGTGFAFLGPVALRAQIDTGSIVTGMLPQVFDQLGIGPFRVVPARTPSTTPGAPFHCEQFDVGLALVSGMDRVELPSVWVIASPDFRPDENVQAIIGRDVLDHCVFTYEGPHRTFALAF